MFVLPPVLGGAIELPATDDRLVEARVGSLALPAVALFTKAWISVSELISRT